MSLCQGSLFGNNNKYIKFSGGDIIAVEGANTMERLIASNLRIPYEQVLKSRIILKPGKTNYLLNFLGLGDNATFLAIKATYHKDSVIEEDNYITWNFYDNFSNQYPMKEFLLLTGNSENRIKQLYLTNPNTKYQVVLDVMVAIIDDETSVFTDEVNQTGLSFTDLTLESIETWVENQSIVIYDNNVPRKALAYIVLNNISSIERIGKLLILDDTALGKLFLDFSDENEAKQAHSAINYVSNTDDIVLQNLSPREDNIAPIVYFNDTVKYNISSATVSGATISVLGTSSNPVNTTMGTTFSTQMILGSFSSSVIDKDDLNSALINKVEDNRDGLITLNDDNLLLKDNGGTTIAKINSTGTHSFSFVLDDIAGNSVNTDIKFIIDVI